jgi:hypothetical protein
VVFENRRLLELAADPHVRDLGFGEACQVDRLVEEDGAFVRPCLAGDDVHHRRLAGAVGTDDAAQFAGVDRQRQLVQRSKTVEADRDVFEIEDDLVRQVELARFEQMPEFGSAAVPVGVVVLIVQQEIDGVHAWTPFAAGASSSRSRFIPAVVSSTGRRRPAADTASRR